jgi:hypothetical protein
MESRISLRIERYSSSTNHGEFQQISRGWRHGFGPRPRSPQGVLEDGKSAESNYRQRWRGPWSSTEGCIHPPTKLQRPLQLLYPLEISSEPPTTEVISSEITTTEVIGPECESTEQQTASFEPREQEEEPPNSSRPQREAAIQKTR